MSITKFASVELLSAEVGGNRESRRRLASHLRVHPDQVNRPSGYPLTRTAQRRHAHRAEFSYEKRPGYIYVRSRAISSRCNENYDEFGADEIRKAYKTFIGRPVFVNHDNADHRKARGVVIDAALHEDRLASGEPDTWVEVLMEIDAKNFPKLAKAILAGHIERTSMGVDVAESECSACGNVATTPLEFCLPPGTSITMSDGTLCPIEDVREGDRVLTHDGVGRVTATMERDYRGSMSVLSHASYGSTLRVTYGHEVLGNSVGGRDNSKSGDERYASVYDVDNWSWMPSEDVCPSNWVQGAYPVEERDFLVDLVDLAPDIEDVGGVALLCTPTTAGPKRALTDDQADEIRRRRPHESGADLAREFGVAQSLISTICSGKAYTGDPEPRVAWVRSGMDRFISSSPELALLLGWYVAEGSVEGFTPQGTPKVVAWSLNGSEGWVVDRLDEALEKFRIQPAKRYRPSENRLIAKVSNAPLAALLCHLGGRCTAENRSQKVLSGEVMLMPTEHQDVMLDAYGSGDGWDATSHVKCYTSSDVLARQLVMIGARVYDQIPSWYKYQGNPGGPTHREKMGTIHHVSLGRRNSMKGRRRLHPGYYASRVQEAETEFYEGPVYNIEVGPQNSYVAEGVVVHNCEHVPAKKGTLFRKTLPDGTVVEEPVHERCSGLSFFENSLLVEEPADPTAAFTGVDASGIDEPYTGTLKAASKQAARWEVTPEDPNMQWTLPLGDDDLYAVVTDRSFVGGYAPHHQSEWEWSVHRLDQGSLGNGVEQTEEAAKTAAERFLEVQRTGSKTASRSSPALQGVDEAFTEMTRTAKISSRTKMAQRSFDDAVQTARQQIPIQQQVHADPPGFVIHDVDGDHRVYKDSPQAPGGMLPSSPRPGTPVARVGLDGEVVRLGVRQPRQGRQVRSSHLVGVNEAFSQIAGARRHGIGETKVPLDVDTLGDTECPVCGNDSGSYDGTECPECDFVKPPDPYMDPDLDKAKELRERDDEEVDVDDEEGVIDTDDHEDDDPLQGQVEFRLPKNESRSCPPAHESAATDRRASRGAKMPASKKLTVAARQQAQIAKQAEMIGQLKGAVSAIAHLAGLENHPRVAAVLRQADVDNPAQPVPEPATEAPSQTTEEAAGTVTDENSDNIDSFTPKGGPGGDDLFAPGGTSVNETGPDAQTDLESVFDTVADAPIGTGNHDVEAPVDGTTEPNPIDEVRIEKDVRVDNSPTDVANPLQGPFADSRQTTEESTRNPDAPGTQASAQPNQKRAWKSLHLARLRIESGLAQGSDITEGQKIAESSMSDGVIDHEITTLKNMASRQPVQQSQASQTRQPRQARRSVPSLATQGGTTRTTSDSHSSVEDGEVLW